MTYKIKVIKSIIHINIIIIYILKIYILNKHTINKYKCSINAFDWKYIYSEIDLELVYDKLINDLVELFNLSCPIIKVKEKI